eukprot:NODE_24_length_36516_cov_0.652470.p17 type:complete len:148 gc:universal NODE_24_length_36516_cov_0.652470:6053-6496(+)
MGADWGSIHEALSAKFLIFKEIESSSGSILVQQLILMCTYCKSIRLFNPACELVLVTLLDPLLFFSIRSLALFFRFQHLYPLEHFHFHYISLLLDYQKISYHLSIYFCLFLLLICLLLYCSGSALCLYSSYFLPLYYFLYISFAYCF